MCYPQLISIFTFICLLLPPAFSTGLVAKTGCQERCGDISIPFPFGVGSGCSLDPYFDITCNTSFVPPRAYLSTVNKEVIEISETYIRVKNPFMISACYDQSGSGIFNVTEESYKHRMSVNLSGTPYSFSTINALTVIGCDDALLESNGSFRSGGCSAFCPGRNDAGVFGYCPFNTTLGYGCCFTTIPGVTEKSFMEAKLIDLSRKLVRRKIYPCSYAFIQERWRQNETTFSYPLHYLENSTTMLNDDWASTTRPPVVRLDWKIGTQNCSVAQKNLTTYACRDKRSVCVDNSYYPGDVVRGYRCSCLSGYEGNPYLPGGCQEITVSSLIAKPGCTDQCGKLAIPFPFGIGPNCYHDPSFEIICNTSTNPPKAYLSILNKEIFHLNSSQVRINYPNLGLACYNQSGYNHGITKTEDQSLIIDLSTTPYTLSDENWIITIGCDEMMVGKIGRGNQSFIGTSCATICQDRPITLDSYGYCPQAFLSTYYYPEDGCCRAAIPRGTTYIQVNLTDLSGQWPRTNFSCGYAFITYMMGPLPYRRFQILNNSTGITPDVLFPPTYWGSAATILELHWRIGVENCKEAQQNPANFICQANSDCVDFDDTVKGYLCNCSKGYQGNPYLKPGCQDINECLDNTTNPCGPNSICFNVPGSAHCSCRKGYYGDGRKDGQGCLLLPPSKSKMIILTGVGSGLGFLLLLLMCLWFYKVFQKRKEKLRKERFFKRNGGLLLRQQKDEGTFEKTKVFPASELEIATDHFNASRILGHGGQGTVYKGMLSDGKIVAIKKSKLVEDNQVEQFINEVVILSHINHRNVVRLLGCCLETEVPLLVYEFMPNGTLFELIHDTNNEFPVPWSMRLKIAADIAGALAYLHSASSTPIYHRDVKSSNILLDEKYVVKVSDFGTSRSVAADQTHLTTMVKGTFGYVDPEYFQSSQFTEKSDVYSFGVVLVELLTGQRPISKEKIEDDRGLAARFLTSMEENTLNTMLDSQVSEQGLKEEVTLVSRLAQRCLNLKGKMRPTMKEVTTELESYRYHNSVVNDKSEDVSFLEQHERDFEDIHRSISNSEYTWTSSYKSDGASPSSSDTLPLVFTQE